MTRIAATFFAAAAIAFVSIDADARSDRPSGGFHGAKPVAGGHGRHWHGHHRGHGHHWGGHRWHGGHWHHGHRWHGHHHLALGIGIGLGYPFWGWGHWPRDYVVVDRVYYDRPVGVVVEREGASGSFAPGYRWYCTAPAGYHPEVRECPSGWLRVLPPDVNAPSPSAPPRSSVEDGSLAELSP
ncbi:MAG TPA: hypothetical protein VNE58_00495 [Casimicrobiaceae bacterium]|nr:hypothetical protein [Casimicrobiaceae bacterium]